MAFIEVDDIDFEETLNEEFEKKQTIILKFGSVFCDACIALDFELEEIDDKYENISVLNIDCAEAENVAEQYGISQVPTMIIFEDKDTTLWHKDGVVLAQDIETILGY